MLNIHDSITQLTGQCIKTIKVNVAENQVIIKCKRDNRFAAIDPKTGKSGVISKLVKRLIKDVPLFGKETIIEAERAQVRINRTTKRM